MTERGSQNLIYNEGAVVKLVRGWLTFMAVVTVLVTGCATTRPHEKEVKIAPQITSQMSTEELVAAATDFGGDTARQARRVIQKRKAWADTEKLVIEILRSKTGVYSNVKMANAMMLYLSGPVKPSAELFRKLVESESTFERQLAWQMAGAMPGKTMQLAIERELNRALLDGDEKDILIPAMGLAVQTNRMTSAYTMVRQGLMTTGAEEFASAMAVLDPHRAVSDFIDYLSTCPPEDLRQISLQSINVYAAQIALRHLIKNLPSLSHPQIEVVFYYAISRNPGLADLGNQIVELLAAKNQRDMAIRLSRLPTWVQIAYIENSRQNMSATKRVFLSELRRTSPQRDVADELNDSEF
jgi:hypothetical protein